METADYLVAAIDAAARAGAAILEVYGTDFGVDIKADRSPLTRADLAAHAVIRDRLRATALPLLSEEGRDIPYDERRGWGRFWMVDPLDGTKEFVKRNGEFTVNIALIDDQRPVLGVIFVPVSGACYFAAEALGAYKVERVAAISAALDGWVEAPEAALERLLAVAHPLPLVGAAKRPFTVAASRSHVTDDLQRHLSALAADHPDMVRISAGSSLKFCLVAEGAADKYPRLGPTMEWDTAAGQAIVACAGGRVVTYEEGDPLRYNKPDLHNPWFIVRR
ncbi:3'(2'),5'-bisphosphate nucleotidase CysQ [Desulfatitalea alkaliphila]|uniref:3'(2'),5'-bisphosphate nucleotidase CysQ n=1 Tax=Desulfatitalea alkaliphila TaxID=2929485 RepID=A0AA41R8A3_9BACT|nr:3'(2'),5'-bisphosphate nucleotidase CysQ [Desulfatitalea alkaliphila]MCJ8503045.1 3'(2'),5'-bisphosphate nucleotidase CysQ [Desulfatitalea alkaliphila]